jgi:hypothetical protein
MAAKERVADMTMAELQTMIEQTVERQLRGIMYTRRDPRSMETVLASIERNRWTPPPGSKSVLEMLREDRDA